MGSAVHKPQIRTSATRRTSPSRQLAVLVLPTTKLAGDPGPPDDTGATCRVVFPCTVPGMVNDDYAFPYGHGAGLQWTVRRLPFRRGVPRGAGKRPVTHLLGALRANLSTVDDAQEPSELAAGCQFPGIQEALDSPRYFVSYRRWFEVGDPPLTSLTRPRLRSLLTPLVSRRSTSQGVEEEATRGDRGLTRPQPSTIARTADVNHQRSR